MHKVNPHTKLCFNIIVLCLLNIVTVITLLSNAANADSTSSASSTASVTVPEACTMTSHNDTPHTATLSPNTYSGASGSEYANGIGKTTLTATCNDDNGFAIYAIGYTGNSYDSENHNKLVGQSTNAAINTAVYTSGDTTSSWSMKVNKINDSTVSYNPQNMSILDSFDSWHIVPATYTKVAQYKASTGSSTTDTTLGAKVETTYAAYIASNQPADTYMGQVKYTMIHPYNETSLQPQTCSSGYICYFANTVTAEGTMGRQAVYSSDTFERLYPSNFSRNGYGFAGWSDKFDYDTNSEAHFYGPGEDIYFSAGQYTGNNPGLSLYAIWVKSSGSLQDTSRVSELCGNTGSLTAVYYNSTTGELSANLSSIAALTDNRDNQTYAIAKLADNNCWIIENLRLDNSGRLTLANTNNPLNDGVNVTLKHNYTDATTFSTLSSTSKTRYNADTSPDGWCSSDSSSCNDQSRVRTDNTTERTSYAPNDTMAINNDITRLYSYGNYYNWYSATAGRGTYGKASGNVEGDICPNGWMLPYGNSGDSGDNLGNTSGGIYYLNQQMGGNNETQSKNSITGITMMKYWAHFPNNFVTSGSIPLDSGAAITGGGVRGYYWLSTAQSDRLAYHLYYYSGSTFRPGTPSTRKYVGMPVRCVIKQGLPH